MREENCRPGCLNTHFVNSFSCDVRDSGIPLSTSPNSYLNHPGRGQSYFYLRNLMSPPVLVCRIFLLALHTGSFHSFSWAGPSLFFPVFYFCLTFFIPTKACIEKKDVFRVFFNYTEKGKVDITSLLSASEIANNIFQPPTCMAIRHS